MYLRNDGSKIEVCGVGSGGTVCLAGASNISAYSEIGSYASDFEDVTEDSSYITTTAGLQATGLKGYSLAKAEEMLNKGASSCNVSSSGDVYCYMAGDGGCYIYDNGYVSCYDGGLYWSVYSDGSTYNHSTP